MGRHTKLEQPDDEPWRAAQAPSGPLLGAPAGSSYEAFSGPTDDQVFVSSYEGGPMPRPEDERQYGPPAGQLFDSFPDARVASPAGSRADRKQRAPSSGQSPKNGATRLFARMPLPLLPIVAFVISVGVVAYALSTQQISLNFAGGAPKDPTGNAQDSQVSQRGPGQRASRGSGRPDGLVIAFRVVTRTPAGYKATATITNQGQAAVTRWALTFKIQNSSVRAVSGATVTRVGTFPFVRGRTGIAPGQSVRIVFTATGVPKRPGFCVLNRLACTFA